MRTDEASRLESIDKNLSIESLASALIHLSKQLENFTPKTAKRIAYRTKPRDKWGSISPTMCYVDELDFGDINTVYLREKETLQATNPALSNLDEYIWYWRFGEVGGAFPYNHLILAMLKHHYKKTGHFISSQADVLQIVKQLKNELTKPQIGFKYIIPLSDVLRLPEKCEKLKLTHDLTLRYLSEAESIFIHKASKHLDIKGDSIIGLVGYTDIPITFDFGSADKKLHNPLKVSPFKKRLSDIWERVDLVLSAFFLEADWYLETRSIHFISDEDELIHDYSFSLERDGGLRLKSVGQYALTMRDVRAIKKNIRSIPHLEKHLENALLKLLDASFRHKKSEAIIDCVVGCEMILLHGQKPEMMNFKMSIHYAVMDIGVTPDEKMRRYKEMQSILERRNALVHGETPTKNDQINQLAKSSKDVLRRCIKSALELQMSSSLIKKDNGFWKNFYLGRIFGAVY